MLGGNGIAPGNAAPLQAAVHLFDSGVDGAQSVQSLAELGRQTTVGQRGVGEESVTSRARTIQQIQKGGAGGLILKGHVRMPCHRVGVCGEKLGARSVVGTAVNQVNFGEALGSTRGLVDMVAAKVGAKFDGFVDGEFGKVLIAEGYDLPLGDEQGQLVLAFLGELAQLDPAHLSTNGRRELFNRSLALGQKIREGCISILAVVVVLEWRQGSVSSTR